MILSVSTNLFIFWQNLLNKYYVSGLYKRQFFMLSVSIHIDDWYEQYIVVDSSVLREYCARSPTFRIFSFKFLFFLFIPSSFLWTQPETYPRRLFVSDRSWRGGKGKGEERKLFPFFPTFYVFHLGSYVSFPLRGHRYLPPLLFLGRLLGNVRPRVISLSRCASHDSHYRSST